MKNIQFIDGADNAAYDVFVCDDGDFSILFPQEGQDIEFIEDVIERIGDDAAGSIIGRVSKRPLRKSVVQGIHGTLFFGLSSKKEFYPRRREADLDHTARGWVHG
ncbi:hypothetical protein FHT85_005928 [Rhizobium sp. BK312]|uniref:hypothetical protein n=1 Tax=Rhizobium sp. BK312 TaxID=2587080 RepID=UPI000DD6FA42|nr:hypothetical protein [Rhizobium sp. BK312]MBB3428897.1 hypothetical protein [Rhizobium sp. BK312]